MTNQKETLNITHPELAAQWHPTLNGELTPQSVTLGSKKKVYWICGEGHTFEASIGNRVKGTNCPFCANQRVLSGFNDLATKNPALAAQWDVDKNGELTPQMVTPGSNKRVHWVCELNHHWEARINDRNDGRNCPVCAGQEVLAGFNDLETTHPELVQQWDYTKNGDLLPQDVTGGSGKRVYWVCEHGHSWDARIDDRTRKEEMRKDGTLKKGRGCPICAGQRVLAGFNDLETLRPDIAKDWDTRKNGDLTPDQFSVGSGKKVHWVCEHGHEREETINTRRKNNGCLICRKNESKELKKTLKSLNPSL